MLIKRKLMLASVGLLALAGCTAAQIESTAATIEGNIQAGAAALCGIVPTISTILAVAGAVTGTSEITAIANAGITAIENDICSAAPAATSARYRALPRRGAAPAVIGTTAHGVKVTGWRS